jgi:hypothetical protein
MFHVLWLCHEACKFYADELAKRDRRNLLIAALFHDFDHLGNQSPDQLNINRAIAGLRVHVSKEDLPHLTTIEALIQATHYPYLIPSESLELPARIIRDADVGQTLTVAWIQQVIFGLAAEWGEKPMELLEMQFVPVPFTVQHRVGAQHFSKRVHRRKIKEATELLSLLRANCCQTGCVQSSKIPCGRPWRLAIHQRSHHHQSG